MKEETKETIIAVIISVLLIGGLFGGFLYYVGFMFDKNKQELHTRIQDNINLSDPFSEVITISSSFISGAEGWYFVSVLAVTSEYPDPQWIYDFEYDDNTDTLYYRDNIPGIGVKNPDGVV